MVKRVVPIAVLLVVAVAFCGPGEAAVYNLHLVTDNVPDYTDLESLVQSSTAAWQTPQDKCIAVCGSSSCRTAGGNRSAKSIPISFRPHYIRPASF